MSTLTTTIKAAIAASLVGDADLAVNSAVLAAFADIILSDGTGANQADIIFADKRTLAISTAEELDLAGGSLEDPVGKALTFVTIKAILVRAAAGNGGNIQVGGAAANAFLGPFANSSDKIVLDADGVFLAVVPGTGWTVTAGTGDLLKIENTDGAATGDYDIIIIGTSA